MQPPLPPGTGLPFATPWPGSPGSQLGTCPCPLRGEKKKRNNKKQYFAPPIV